MKTHLAKLSLALLSTVFLLGCQDLGSGPVGPDGPQFDKPFPDQAGDPCDDAEPDGPKRDLNGHCHGDDGVDPVLEPGTLFKNPDFMCADGATNTGDAGSFGTVNFNQPRDDSHTHANVQLRGVDPGVYLIWGNHDKVCQAAPGNIIDFEFPVFDFPLRPGHATKVTVGANGKGKARIGLTYVTETPETRTIEDENGNEVIVDGFDFLPADLSAMHVNGEHRLWVTVTGPVDPDTLEPLNVTQVFLRSVAVLVNIPVHDEP